MNIDWDLTQSITQAILLGLVAIFVIVLIAVVFYYTLPYLFVGLVLLWIVSVWKTRKEKHVERD